MHVRTAVRQRSSIRVFSQRAVPLDVVRRCIDEARRSPSGGNLQPWRLYVLAGEAHRRFLASVEERLTNNPQGDPADYEIYPPKLHEPYRSRRYQVGEDMYALLGIGRDDKPSRLRWVANNYRFFGAPVALFCFVDRKMGPPQWSDLGMYLQTLMLLLQAEGIDSCAQESWSRYHRVVSDFVGAPDDTMLFCGLAIGFRDPQAEVNSLVSARAPLAEVATFMGFGDEA